MLLDIDDCQLVLVDYQARLMPALSGGEGALQACSSVPADTNAATAIAAVLLGGIVGGLQVDLVVGLQ